MELCVLRGELTSAKIQHQKRVVKCFGIFFQSIFNLKGGFLKHKDYYSKMRRRTESRAETPIPTRSVFQPFSSLKQGETYKEIVYYIYNKNFILLFLAILFY